MKSRLNYIDIAKGIGILMVIVGHCGSLPSPITKAIFSVHMPLFFILSGYFYNPKPNMDKKIFIKKSAKSLLVPYALTCVFVIALRIIRTIIAKGDVFYTCKLWLFASLYGSGTIVPDFFSEHGIPMRIIGAIWFLLALFFGRIFLMYILESKINPFFLAVVVSYIGYATTDWFWLPFSFQAGLNCVIFLYIGYYIKTKDLFSPKAIAMPIKLLMAGTWLVCIIFGGALYMVRNYYGNGIFDIIGAVCGTFIIVYISQWIEKHIAFLCRLLSGIGRISLGVMCAHLITINCWPQERIAPLLQSVLSLPVWIINVLCILSISFLVTFLLYLTPWINNVFFSGAKITMVYKEYFNKKKKNKAT